MQTEDCLELSVPVSKETDSSKRAAVIAGKEEERAPTSQGHLEIRPSAVVKLKPIQFRGDNEK